MTRLLALTIAAVLGAAPAATAQQHPGFSGTWKLNTEKSDAPGQFGGGPGAQAARQNLVVTIVQSADSLVITQTVGGQGRTIVQYFDGKPHTGPGARGGEMTSTSRWDRGALVSEGSMNMDTPRGAMAVTFKETRTLSADGKTMTVVSTTETPRGERTRKTVFDKQT